MCGRKNKGTEKNREATRKMFSLSKTYIISSPLHEAPVLWLVQSSRFPELTLILERKRKEDLPLLLPLLPSHHPLPFPSPPSFSHHPFLSITPFLPINLFHCYHPFSFPSPPSNPSPSCVAITFYLLILPSSLVPLPFSSHNLLLISFLFFKLLFVLEGTSLILSSLGKRTKKC